MCCTRSEIQVRVVLALGVRELLRIAVGAAYQGQERLPGAYLFAIEFQAFDGNPARCLDRSLVAEDLLDSAADQSGLAAQTVHLLGVAQQREQPVADQVACGFVAGHEQQHALRDQFVVGQFVAVFLARHHHADHVIGRMRTLVLSEVAQVIQHFERCLGGTHR